MAGGSDAVDMAALSCAKCGKPAHLQCPKCVELKLPREGAAFCSQDCFKESWTSHKSVHLKSKLSSTELENPGEQNSGLSNDGWLYCSREGQARSPKIPHFDWTGSLRPYPISKMRLIPANIDQPDWAIDGIPKSEPNSNLQHHVEIKNSDQIEKMREACRIGREVLDSAARIIRPGITTDEIDAVVHDVTIAAGGYPSPLNYRFFPKSCCLKIDYVHENGQVAFRDGALVQADIIFHCTGYRRSFPFLKTDGIVNVEDNRVGPLYKHIFPPQLAPNLSFVGLPYQTVAFLMIELQAKWVSHVLTGSGLLPSEEEMVAEVEEHYQQMEAKGIPQNHTHCLHLKFEYLDWLATQVGLDGVCESFKLIADGYFKFAAAKGLWKVRDWKLGNGIEESLTVD